jgi:hypothetical protein
LELMKSKKLIFVFVPSVLFSAYYLLSAKILEAVVCFAVGVLVFYLLKRMGRRRVKTKIDYNFTAVIFHMYGLRLVKRRRPIW